MAPDYILNFVYSGTEVAIDIEVTEHLLLNQAKHIIDDLEVMRANEIYKGMKEGLSRRKAENAANKIVLTIIQDGEGIIKRFENTQNRIVAELTKNIIAAPSTLVASKNPGELFEWRLGSVKTTHCPDCNFASGLEPRTLAEWKEVKNPKTGKLIGLPREGKTACNVGCQCMFKPVKRKDGIK